jgi:hypothetical protein
MALSPGFCVMLCCPFFQKASKITLLNRYLLFRLRENDYSCNELSSLYITYLSARDLKNGPSSSKLSQDNCEAIARQLRSSLIII